MDFFRHDKVYDFVKYSNYGFMVVLILIIAIVILFFTKGINLGIDFAGGSVAQIQYNSKEAPISDIRKLLNQNTFFKDSQITEFGSKNEIIIKFPFIKDANIDISDEIKNTLNKTGDFEIRRIENVGPKAGSELAKNGIIAIVLAIIAMMIYVSFRYEWRFALASIVALIHDVIISGAAIMVFNIDLSLDVIAALLTLIGYSINDTIIIFDRIREQMLSKKFNSVEFVINDAISKTLSRTLLTSLTVFFVIAILFFFGSEILKGFTLPMLIGSIVGTYSSMFVAPKLAILFGFNIEEYYAKEAKKQQKRQEKERLRKMYETGRI
ncbi:protein translocase subunit SecF [Helicobacter sp. MIT 14-3879]|uniref:protein translocase subunit SecF n=1 Tax=Helicobacter sp. MIT 14-3879 TaxID=2040649 RepID=UPI000E1E54D7|nr:protein translocase subunit SecF [Helicobacter sp. MIT 14-3879]RDU65439.1 protein translocase subunit SecF [Helicobacter sp. MIT 14-3879]